MLHLGSLTNALGRGEAEKRGLKTKRIETDRTIIKGGQQLRNRNDSVPLLIYAGKTENYRVLAQVDVQRSTSQVLLFYSTFG